MTDSEKPNPYQSPTAQPAAFLRVQINRNHEDSVTIGGPLSIMRNIHRIMEKREGEYTATDKMRKTRIHSRIAQRLFGDDLAMHVGDYNLATVESAMEENEWLNNLLAEKLDEAKDLAGYKADAEMVPESEVEVVEPKFSVAQRNIVMALDQTQDGPHQQGKLCGWKDNSRYGEVVDFALAPTHKKTLLKLQEHMGGDAAQVRVQFRITDDHNWVPDNVFVHPDESPPGPLPDKLPQSSAIQSKLDKLVENAPNPINGDNFIKKLNYHAVALGIRQMDSLGRNK